MPSFRSRLRARDTRSLAPIGEGCALFGALSSFVFCFCTGFVCGSEHFRLYALFRSPFGAAAGSIALASVSVLFALTLLRYVRFLRGRSEKDSLYFCYAVYLAYLAGIVLLSACAARGGMRIDGVTCAGVALGGAGTAASLVLFLIAKGKEPRTRERTARYGLGVVQLALLLMTFALFALGPAPMNGGDAVPGYDPLFARLGERFAQDAPVIRTGISLGTVSFLLLLAHAAFAVLLAERLLGGIAQLRKPTLWRALAACACGMSAAATQLSLCMHCAQAANTSATFTVPLAAMVLCALLALSAAADALLARSCKEAPAAQP